MNILETLHWKRFTIALWLPMLYLFYLFDSFDILVFIVIILGIFEIYMREPISNLTILAMLQILGLCFLFIFPIKETLLLVVIIFTNDTAAFYGGKYFKKLPWMKKRIFPETSPNKTAGGLFWGVLFGSAAGIIFISLTKLPFYYTLAPPLICLAGVAGDFLNSKFKCFYNIKDSGEDFITHALLCGHGGIYDRFDALALTCLFWTLTKIPVYF